MEGSQAPDHLLLSFVIPGPHLATVPNRSQVSAPRLLPAANLIQCAAHSRRSIADVFRIQVVSNSDVRSPIITLGSTSFFHVRINNLYIVAVTKWVLGYA